MEIIGTIFTKKLKMLVYTRIAQKSQFLWDPI